jgi:hypothetical protein
VIVAGTLIATPAGDVPVEALRPGDHVHALEQGQPVARPLRWVGRLEVDLARHHSPARAAPVRVAAGALAPGLPARDLLVSPDHALLLAGALFQAQALRNGATVAQATAPEKIAYVHLELARHGVVLAEGAAVESYLDTGNRGLFSAGRPLRGLAPDLAAAPGAGALAVWKARGCAPLRLDTTSIVPVHAGVLRRARAFGWSLTDDPGLSVLADGSEAPLARFAPDHFRALLPQGARAVRLASRCFVPADLDAGIPDRRQLGIAVRALRLAGRALSPGAFSRGWHLSEAEWRWTDGDARLTLRALPAATTLEIRIAPGAVPGYWLAPA